MFVILRESKEPISFLSEINLDDHEDGSVSVRSWGTGPLSGARWFDAETEANDACELLNRASTKPDETYRVVMTNGTEYIRADLVSPPAVPVIEKGCFTVVEGLLDYQLSAIIAAYESTAIAAWTEGDIYNDKYAVGFQTLNIHTDYIKGVEDRVTVLSCVSEDLIKEMSCGETMREIPAEEIIAALSQLIQYPVKGSAVSGKTTLKRLAIPLENDKAQEYVRADLVPAQDNADEPLEEGQYRWVRHKATPGWLDIARVSVDYDGMWMNETSGDAYKTDQYVYIGPVIQPPPGK